MGLLLLYCHSLALWLSLCSEQSLNAQRNEWEREGEKEKEKEREKEKEKEREREKDREKEMGKEGEERGRQSRGSLYTWVDWVQLYSHHLSSSMEEAIPLSKQ